MVTQPILFPQYCVSIRLMTLLSSPHGRLLFPGLWKLKTWYSPKKPTPPRKMEHVIIHNTWELNPVKFEDRQRISQCYYLCAECSISCRKPSSRSVVATWPYQSWRRRLRLQSISCRDGPVVGYNLNDLLGLVSAQKVTDFLFLETFFAWGQLVCSKWDGSNRAPTVSSKALVNPSAERTPKVHSTLAHLASPLWK